MDIHEIQAALEASVENLLQNQPNLFGFTNQTGQTEWNIGHHLAPEIYKSFPDHEYDCDVMKRDYGNMRPDIIIHRRGENANNFLVIELKYNGSSRDIEDDRVKILENWFMPPLSYQFGAVINIKTGGEFTVLMVPKP